MSRELKEFINYLVAVKGLSDASVKFYRSDLTQFEEFLGKPIIKAKDKDVLDFLETLKKEENGKVLNQRTINRKLSSINSFFNFAYDREIVDDKVSVLQIKPPRELPKYLTKEEIMGGVSLIDRDDWIGLRDKALILLLYATGLRVSEAMNLKVEDIQEDWIVVRDNGGAVSRVLPVASMVLKVIDEYLYKRTIDSEYLFINNRGTKLSRITAFNITKQYLKVSPTILRHSFATSLVLGGADLAVVQEFLGHTTLTSTQVYSLVKQENLKELIEKYHPLKELKDDKK